MILSRTVCKARKEHHCCECHKAINAGRSYEIESGVYDSRMYTVKTCLTCAERREHMYASLTDLGMDSDDGPEYGGMYQWYYEVRGVEYKD